jgi:hypothetical protein
METQGTRGTFLVANVGNIRKYERGLEDRLEYYRNAIRCPEQEILM